MEKILVRKVELVFFCDEANGEWGTAHRETYDHSMGDGFNAFWDGMGMFHDVFEHAHEFTDKHFRGDAAMNIGGEMAASGAMWYYINQLGMSKRLRNGGSYWPLETLTVDATFNMVQEAIADANCPYGYTLVSGVPTQKDTCNYGLESLISEYEYRVRGVKVKQKGEYTEDHEIEFGRAYKKSCTPAKIRNLHRYGYNLAKELVPEAEGNAEVLDTFKVWWDTFCKANEAEEIANLFHDLEISIFRDDMDRISWEAKFCAHAGGEIADLVVDAEHRPGFYILDELEYREGFDPDQLTMELAGVE